MMESLSKNKKIIYGIIALIIIAGIIVTCAFKFNFSLMYKEHERITIYIGKEYKIADINKIAKEVFEGKKVQCEKLEIYNDTPIINVEETTQEQLEQLKQKIAEKYEIENSENLIQTSKVVNTRGRDIVKPYIVPTIITTLIILVYVTFRYKKLGILNIIFDFILKLLISETVYLSILSILRIPIGIYTMPVAILIYIITTIICVYIYQLKLDKSAKQKQ